MTSFAHLVGASAPALPIWTPESPSVSVSLSPSGSSSPKGPRAPLVRVKPPRARFRWQGRIVGFALPGDMPPEELALLYVDGDRYRLAHPDAVALGGQPINYLPQRTRRTVDRLLERLALSVVESRVAPVQPIVRAKNAACNGGRGNLLNFVITASGYTGVQYFAVGTVANPQPSASDAQLGTEFFRKQPTSYTVSGNQALVNTNFLSSDAVGTYTEAGVFGSAPAGTSGAASGGTTASATANTGMLFARATYPYTKASGVLLANNYYITES